mgnify:CR=1 FL=1
MKNNLNKYNNKQRKRKGIFFDFLVKNIIVFSIIFILIFKVFILYSPLSSDKKYQDFYLQIKYILDLSTTFKLKLENYHSIFKDLHSQQEFIKTNNLDTIFKGCYIKEDTVSKKIVFLTSYNTESYFENNNFIIETMTKDNYIPLKVMLDIDTNLDDGIPSNGKIKSNINNYSVGCKIIINVL